MIIYTVKDNNHVQFLYIDVYMYCKFDEVTRIFLFFLINCYIYYPVSYKYLKCLIFTFENFIFFCLFSEIKIRKSEIRKKNSPLMNACVCSYFWRYHITQLNSTMTFFLNWCLDEACHDNNVIILWTSYHSLFN